MVVALLQLGVRESPNVERGRGRGRRLTRARGSSIGKKESGVCEVGGREERRSRVGAGAGGARAVDAGSSQAIPAPQPWRAM